MIWLCQTHLSYRLWQRQIGQYKRGFQRYGVLPTVPSTNAMSLCFQEPEAEAPLHTVATS